MNRFRDGITLSVLIGMLLLALGLVSPAATDAEPTSSAKITFLLIYRPGPAWPQGKHVSELPLKEHRNYMLSLYKRGAMKLAGPLTDNAGGAVVLEVSGEAEAKAIATDDPAVRAGIFVYELHPWALVPWEKLNAKDAS
jgi:uncharacterized protein